MSLLGLQNHSHPIDEINRYTRNEFVSLLGSIFENSPWIANKAWDLRPFSSRNELLEAMVSIIRHSEADKKVLLIQAHPDLAGRLAQQGLLTEASQHEQASAGLDQLSTNETRLFSSYNEKYKNHFGFPFVICARLNDKRSILSAFERRLQSTRNDEIETALDEIEKIAAIRIAKLVQA